MKKLLKTGSYINFGFAALQYLFSGFTISISILFLVITGFIYLEFSKEEKTIIQNRNFLIVLGLISLFFNFITGIIVLIATDKKHEKEFLNSGNVKVKEEIDPSKKKIDILLKLGVGMVIVSGIIFATSSWDNIPDLLKFIFLVVLSVIFYGLYYFSFFKLQIKQSAFVYYMLTFLFIFFAYVSVGYYSLLGGWFSMHGAGMYLYYASVYLLLSIVSYIINNKYPKNIWSYITYGSLFLVLALILKQLKLPLEFILLVLISNTTLISLLHKSNNESGELLYKTALATNILISIIFLFNAYSFKVSYIFLSLSILIIYNSFNQLRKQISSFWQVVVAINIPLNIYCAFMALNTIRDIQYILISSSFLVIYIISLILNNKEFKKYFLKTIICLINIIGIAMIFNSSGSESYLVSIFVAISLLINNLLYYLLTDVEKTPTIEKYLQAAKVFLLSVVSLNYIHDKIYPLSIEWTLIITSIIILGLFILLRNKKQHSEYYIVFLISNLLTMIISISSDNVYVLSGLLILSMIPYIISHYKKGVIYEKTNLVAFIYLLLNTFIIIYHAQLVTTSDFINSLIVLIIYLILVGLLNNNKPLSNIVQFAIVLPFSTFVNSLNLNTEIDIILNASLYLYLTYLLCHKIIKNDKTKNVISAIAVSLILLIVIFSGDWIIGLYVGIVSLLTIIIGYSQNEYKSLFVVGIVITIINIIYQFYHVLETIPLWLYLLIGGLGIIGFVMYKEIQKNDN